MQILKAAWRQSLGDLRPNFIGAGLITMLLPSLAILYIARILPEGHAGPNSIAQMFMAGLIGSSSAFVVIQISAEYYSDRLGGALVRVKLLPYGPLAWSIGKTLSCVILVICMQMLVLILGAVFVSGYSMTASGLALSVVIIVVSSVATAPLGLFVGAVLRGVYTQMLAYGVVFLVLATSGLASPLAGFPRWVQMIQLVLPTYWSGHLTRWAFGVDPSWEISGQHAPLLAAGVLLLWIVIGFGVLPFIIKRSFRRESLSTLSRIQSTTRSTIGV